MPIVSAYENLHEETGRVIATLLRDEELGIYMDNQKKEGVNVNMCKALDDLRKEAKSQGIQQGMQSFALLTQKLLLDSRKDDLMRATSDYSWCEKLYREYGIEKMI